ncbi:DUF4956 domain-containing protein [Streptococcus plurextorum]|uniref:DUF4956 domain-containing protein n=1 Tax=Streptococcus plurextorum TaxID=456876 RepID=UPI0003FB5728|nr:DUF4956 domain-containing protein [Streptococcus plurextorum]
MNLFNSIFNSSTSSLNPILLFLALATSLLLGVALAFVYKYRTLYTRDFIVTLTLLPSLMTLIIFLVNGSLGTSIAVAGTFSLIRFRSATSGSRELLAIFLSMIIGLAAGTGYLVLAIVATAILLGLWFFLENRQSKGQTQTRRLLTLTVANSTHMEEAIHKILDRECSAVDLISLKTSEHGQKLSLVYEIDLRHAEGDLPLTNKLISQINQIDISLSTQAKKRKNL